MPVAPRASGTVIAGRYRMDRVLGEGGMGVVWAAERVDTGELVAIKFLKDSTGDGDARRRFVREGRAAQAVRHPHVVTIVEVLELDDGSPAIVMEHLAGESLADKLQRETAIELRELASILVPVISAVGTAHEAGVVHRDLKPENIVLSRAPAASAVSGGITPKVLDFGIAKLTTLDGDAMRSTGVTTGVVMGTPAYMAPEQVFGERDLDHGVDVWALGLILYQGLSGVLPTRADNVGQVLKNVLAKPFTPLDQLMELPHDVSRLVSRMLARERDHRPADLREVFAVLQKHTATTAPSFGTPTRGPAVIAAGAVRATRGALAWAASERPPRRSLARVAGIAVAVAGACAAGAWLVGARRDPSSTAPLAEPATVIGCPIFRVSGVDAPAGWFGAAAAATACERARVILGGRPERTMVPAELLDLPREPVDRFPADPYAGDAARARSLAQARARAAAYLDGEVVKRGSELTVALSLHRADGRELARARGVGQGLYAAVRAAMTPLVGPGLIPDAGVLDPGIAAWSGTREVGLALALLDLNLAIAHNAGGLAAECAQFERVSGRLGELGAASRWLCAYTLGRPLPAVALDGAETSRAAVATRIRLRHFTTHADSPSDGARLHGLLGEEPTSWGRALIAATESCLVQPLDPRRAYELATLAVQTEPKNPDGQACSPWEQLLTLAHGTASAGSVARAMQAWEPWKTLGWLAQGIGDQPPAEALEPLRRAYALSPLNTMVAGALADKLLAVGERGEARALAIAVRTGASPVHELESDLLLLRVEASAAQFGAALNRARGALQIARDDAGWVRDQRFEAGWRALELAHILGRTSEIADLLVERFVDPEPMVLDGSGFLVPRRVPVICAVASPAVSARCFQRFRELRSRLSGGITAETDALARGAERYAQRDYAGAASAWRPLLRGSEVLASVFPGPMADAFERAEFPELAAQVDAAEMARAGEFHGATLAHVRAAHRALRAGQAATARHHARQVIEAWSVADEDVPALAEMQELLR